MRLGGTFDLETWWVGSIFPIGDSRSLLDMANENHMSTLMTSLRQASVRIGAHQQGSLWALWFERLWSWSTAWTEWSGTTQAANFWWSSSSARIMAVKAVSDSTFYF